MVMIGEGPPISETELEERKAYNLKIASIDKLKLWRTAADIHREKVKRPLKMSKPKKIKGVEVVGEDYEKVKNIYESLLKDAINDAGLGEITKLKKKNVAVASNKSDRFYALADKLADDVFKTKYDKKLKSLEKAKAARLANIAKKREAKINAQLVDPQYAADIAEKLRYKAMTQKEKVAHTKAKKTQAASVAAVAGSGYKLAGTGLRLAGDKRRRNIINFD